MKKSEIIKINIYLLLITLCGGYMMLSFIGFLMEMVERIHPVILIVGFCYLIYKTLKNVIEGRI